jgi:hypothetical protein
VFTLLAALAVAGCGGSDSGGSGPAALVTADSPVAVLPADSPVVITAEVGPGSEQGKAALEFASKLDTQHRDLGAELIKSLEDSTGNDVKIDYEADLKPWLGKTVGIALDDFTSSDVGSVVALQSTDQGKAQAFLDKVDSRHKSAAKTYGGVTYHVDPEDNTADGMVEDFVVGATDEAHFKAAVDASKSGSLVDDEQYKTAIGRLDGGDHLGVALVDIDGLLDALAQSGSVSQSTLNSFKSSPSYDPGETAAASLDASSTKMTFETATSATQVQSLTGTDAGTLPGDAWLAFISPIDGKNFGSGFQEGLAQRLGGSSLAGVNGSLKLGDSNAGAAEKLFGRIVQEAKSVSGVEVNASGNTASASAGPYKINLTLDGGDISLSLGDEPSAKLADQASYKSALGDLDGAKALFFMDFAPLAELVKSIPSNDPSTQQAADVLAELGTLVFGAKVDGDVGRTTTVLTVH